MDLYIPHDLSNAAAAAVAAGPPWLVEPMTLDSMGTMRGSGGCVIEINTN